MKVSITFLLFIYNIMYKQNLEWKNICIYISTIVGTSVLSIPHWYPALNNILPSIQQGLLFEIF